MKRALACITLVGFALVGACRTQPQADPMAGMDMSAATADSATLQRAPVHLSTEQARAVGLTFAVVQRGALTRTVRSVGQVVAAEPNLAEITTKIDGFVEQLFVAATGTTVRRGQPLLTLYSPMLVAAQEELLAAKRLAASVESSEPEARRSGEALVEAGRRRLSYWDISREQIDRLERTGEVTKTLRLNAPVNGIVLEKMVVTGQAVMAGMKLYRIANLSTVWIEGAVFEQDLRLARVGAPVAAEIAAYPGRRFVGHVSFVWPTVDEASRSGRVRVEFRNPTGELRPGMYVTLLLEALVASDAVHVPAEAVVQTGERNVVFVVGQGGALEPREVVLGSRAGNRFQISAGLEPGERIVASANFLIDAESRLTAGAVINTMPGMNMNTEKRP
jgi:membrane fusion protein, copper/silver efflux system